MKVNNLGGIALPTETVEHDLAMLDRYQDFSAELLRLSLLAITAIGYALSKVMFPETGNKIPVIGDEIKHLAMWALWLLGVSASAALLHRYTAAAGMSWHLIALRKATRAEESDTKAAALDCRKRTIYFTVSQCSLAISALALTLGGMVIVWSILKMLH